MDEKEVTPEELERAKQYLICQERGHTRSGLVTASIPPQHSCKFCGTYYYFTEPKLVEGFRKPSDAAIAMAKGQE